MKQTLDSTLNARDIQATENRGQGSIFSNKRLNDSQKRI